MKGWWHKLYEKGWIAPNWPRERGGMALDAGKMVVYLEEMERHGVARVGDHLAGHDRGLGRHPLPARDRA